MGDHATATKGTCRHMLSWCTARWKWGVVACVCALAALWPGDAAWGGDQALLVSRALDANEAGTLADSGLQGTRGATYGPLAVWMYQAMLLATHDLVVVVAAHGLLLAACTAAAVWVLARALGLDLLVAAAVVASPQVQGYVRLLWDNPLCIPLSALLLGAWLQFARTGSAAWFRTTLATLLVLPTVHLMTLPLCLPIAVDVALHHGQWRRTWRSAFLVVAAWLGAFLPYLLHHAGGARSEPSYRAATWLFPALGAGLITPWSSVSGAPPEWIAAHLPALATLADVAAAPVLVASWAGAAVLAFACVRPLAPEAVAGLSVRERHVVLAALVLEILATGLTSAAGQTHYFNGTWPVFALLAWIGACSLVKERIAGRLAGALLVVNLATTVALAWSLHGSGGRRDGYGPTLANQIEIVRAIRGAGATEVDAKAPYFSHNRGLSVLDRLEGPAPAPAPGARRLRAVVTLVDPSSPDGRVRVTFEQL